MEFSIEKIPKSGAEGIKMKFRRHMVITISVAAILVCFFMEATRWPKDMPLVDHHRVITISRLQWRPQGRQCTRASSISAAAPKSGTSRHFQSGRRPSEVVNIIDPGVPAFGPNVAGPITVPCAPTERSGTVIQAFPAYGHMTTVSSSPRAQPVPHLSNYPVGATAGLGHFVSGEDAGSFRIFDFHVQANDGGRSSISNTTALSWSKLLTGLTPHNDFMSISYAPAGSGTGTSCFTVTLPRPVPAYSTMALRRGSRSSCGTPYYNEAPSGGFAASTDAGADDGFSEQDLGSLYRVRVPVYGAVRCLHGRVLFQVSRTFSETRQTPVPFARRGFRDTFGFQSSDPAAWTFVNFDSTADCRPIIFHFPQRRERPAVTHENVFHCSRSPDVADNPGTGDNHKYIGFHDHRIQGRRPNLGSSLGYGTVRDQLRRTACGHPREAYLNCHICGDGRQSALATGWTSARTSGGDTDK